MSRSAGEILRELHDLRRRDRFPGLDMRGYSCREDLRSRASWFGNLVDRQIPFGVRVAEIGCGTGQLANFLALKDRLVAGIDVSERSLLKARELRDRLHVPGVVFAKQNLAQLGLAQGAFDYVFSLGAFQHTSDPHARFREIAGLVRPGGFVVMGLYHRRGSLLPRLRRERARDSGSGPGTQPLRPQAGDGDTAGPQTRETGEAGRAERGRESAHTVGEILGWLHESDFELVNSLPPVEAFSSAKGGHRLFHPSKAAPWRRGRLSRLLVELWWIGSLAGAGGYFLLVGRRKK